MLIALVIGICDDEAVIRDGIVKLCIDYRISNICEIETVCFSSGEELLAYEKPIDILFLDIQMKGMNGLRTAEQIRKTDDSLIIIFLTGYKGYMQAGYKVRAFRYLLKPAKPEEFTQTLAEAIRDITKNRKAIVGVDGETRYLKLRDIIYVEYVNRLTVVRTRKTTYESYMTLNDWMKLLDTGDFFRVHKAYIVNMEYIEEINKEVLLENGEKVEIAIRQVGKLKKACKEYRRRNAR